MIVEIPFRYNAAVIPPRKRNPRDIMARDKVAVKIKVLTPDSFPVALRFLDGRMDEAWLGKTEEEEREESEGSYRKYGEEMRWDGKSFYSPFRVNAHSPIVTLPADEAVAALQNGGATPFAVFAPSPNMPETDQIEGDVVTDTKREITTNILKMAQEVVYCDGQFWSPSLEPVWQVVHDDRRPRIIATEYYETDSGAVVNLFRADQVDEAILSAKLHAWEEAEPRILGRLEVLIPEALQLSLDDRALLAEARSFISGTTRKLEEAPVEYLVAWAGLRDALKAVKDSQLTEDVVDAVQGMLNAIPTREDGRSDFYKDHLQWVLERWRRGLLKDPVNTVTNQITGPRP